MKKKYIDSLDIKHVVAIIGRMSRVMSTLTMMICDEMMSVRDEFAVNFFTSFFSIYNNNHSFMTLIFFVIKKELLKLLNHNKKVRREIYELCHIFIKEYEIE